MDNDRHHDSRANENSFICTSCFKSNSFSYIYKCLICPVELCGDCYEKKYETEEHKTEHPLVRLEAPKKFFGLKYSNDETNNNQDNFENSSMRKMNSSKERLHKPDKEEEETKQKIISKLNAFSANSKSDNESDSDNNNDNNNNNNTENEVEVDVQRLGSAKQNESLIKANQNTEFVKLILNFNTAEFVLTPAPQGQTVNCKILCRRGLINEYHFFLEQSDTANILLLKTHKRMASAKASHFIDVINYNEFGQRSSNEISCAKCSSNMARKKFKLNIDTNNFPLVETNTILNVLFRSNSGEPRYSYLI